MMAYNVFHDIAAHACERYWAIVYCLAFISGSFIKGWGNFSAFFQSSGKGPLSWKIVARHGTFSLVNSFSILHRMFLGPEALLWLDFS